MKKEGIDKVTEMVNKEVKTISRGEKCLLLIYEKQEITRNRFLLPCVYVMPDRRSFFVWAKHTLWKNG